MEAIAIAVPTTIWYHFTTMVRVPYLVPYGTIVRVRLRVQCTIMVP